MYQAEDQTNRVRIVVVFGSGCGQSQKSLRNDDTDHRGSGWEKNYHRVPRVIHVSQTHETCETSMEALLIPTCNQSKQSVQKFIAIHLEIFSRNAIMSRAPLEVGGALKHQDGFAINALFE